MNANYIHEDIVQELAALFGENSSAARAIEFSATQRRHGRLPVFALADNGGIMVILLPKSNQKRD